MNFQMVFNLDCATLSNCPVHLGKITKKESIIFVQIQ